MMLEMTDDSARALDLGVFERAQRGDVAAFEQLMRTHERRVLRLAVRLVGNLEDAREISQDVFMKLHRELRRFQERPDLAPWLYRVTVNTCWDYERRNRRSPLVAVGSDSPLWHSPLPNPEKMAVQKRDMDRLNAALLSLSQGERAAIVLREMEGLSTSEVASVLGLAEATVRVQISVARAKLRKSFEAAERRTV
jgi:RNA polymerase sigma-70 factor, ECF subfamily